MPRARRASTALHARFTAATTAWTANRPVIPPPAANTTIVTGTITAPVTRPIVAAVRKRCTPSSTALATLWSVPSVTNAPARTQAASGSAPSRAATTSAAPPASAVTACTRQAHATIASASWVRPAPTASATERITASAMPLVSTSATETAMNEMKLWRPNSDGLRKRAAAIESAKT